MKTTFLIVASCIITFSGYSQQAADSENIDSGNLIAMELGDVEYYMDKASYHLDEEGVASGKVISFYDSGSLEETGYLVKGKRSGNWNKYDEETGSKTYEAHYIDGLKHGSWKVWDANGVLRIESYYDKGKRAGTWKMFDEEGNLFEQKQY
ncbi:MAG: toxin-antitoxin system YwqK family antitoxin [Cryomorphaceae bacterium]|nr:hypothetical protein [Flavobacteriales bacterium]